MEEELITDAGEQQGIPDHTCHLVLVGCGASKQFDDEIEEYTSTLRSALEGEADDALATFLRGEITLGQFISDVWTSVPAQLHGRVYTAAVHFKDYQTREVRARELYTSSYFSLKREYADVHSDSWFVLSAKHGLVRSNESLTHYDQHIKNVDGEAWADRIREQVAIEREEVTYRDTADRILHDRFKEVTHITILAGKKYVEPLAEWLEGLDAAVSFPFQENDDLGGFGDQMGWLRSEIDAAFPEEVNGWTFDPDARYNGDTWTGDDGRVSLHVHDLFGETNITVRDERLSWRGVEPSGLPPATTSREATRGGAHKRAAAWMSQQSPEEWTHPDVNDGVFDAPSGFEVEAYYLSDRKTTIIYAREQPPEGLRKQAIEIDGFHASGTFDISVKHYQEEGGVEEDDVENSADRAGLDAALLRVAEIAADLVPDTHITAPRTAGQTNLSQFTTGT